METFGGRQLLIYWEPKDNATFDYIVDIVTFNGAVERRYRFDNMSEAQAKHAKVRKQMLADEACRIITGKRP